MNEWASVKNKLPPLGKKVIIFSNNVVQNDTYELEHSYDDDYFIWESSVGCQYFMSDEDFWMPLPEPPKGE